MRDTIQLYTERQKSDTMMSAGTEISQKSFFQQKLSLLTEGDNAMSGFFPAE